jgi:hypothetical protein
MQVKETEVFPGGDGKTSSLMKLRITGFLDFVHRPVF